MPVIVGDNWQTISKKITITDLEIVLDTFQLANMELSQKKNSSGLKDASESIKVS